MATMTLVNMVCFGCGIDKIYSIGKLEAPDMAVIMGLQGEMVKHSSHGGYSITIRVEKPEDVEKLLTDIGSNRVSKILKHNIKQKPEN